MSTPDESSYHYTECGLGNIYLTNGYSYVDSPRGKQVIIKNIDELHKVIGTSLIHKTKNLSGKEIKFLRHEMLMSQSMLANLLEVSEQAIRRWENAKTSPANKPAELLIRLLYAEHIKEDGTIRKALRKIADLEDEMDQIRINLSRKGTKESWKASIAA